MLADAVLTLYGYNHWATERVLDTARELTPEQFHAPGHAGRGSIRDTLVHLIGTQRGWLAWWNGSMSAMEAYAWQADPAEYPDIPSVRALWETVEADTAAFVQTLSDAEIARVYETTLPNGAAWQMVLWRMMLHVANHGTQHRSEVAAMLTQHGHSPGDLDLLFYPG
jgi:uncharacterized damage-inducible protein DinB